MAKLLSFQKLIQKDTATFLGVSKGATDGQLVVTYNSNMVMLEDIKTQKRLKTWTADGKPVLSHVVHFDTKLQKFVGIFAEKYMRTWTVEDEDITKLKKVKLYRLVHAVTVADDGRVIILYKNSFCESVESALQSVQERKQEDFNKRAHREIELQDAIDVKCFHSRNYGHVFSFCVREEDSSTLELNLVSLQEETLQPNGSYKKITIDNSSANHARLLGWTIFDFNDEPTLVTFWTNRNLFARPIFSKTCTSPQGEFIANLSFVSAEYPVAMVAVGGKGSPYIAFYACNNNLDGATLFMFNLQYRIIQSRQPFKVFFQMANLDTFDQYIFLDAGQFVNAVSYRITLDKLANLISSRREMLSFEQIMNTESYDSVYIQQVEEGEEVAAKDKSQDRLEKFNERRTRYFGKNFPKAGAKKKQQNFASREFESAFEVENHIRELSDEFLPVRVTVTDDIPDVELLITPNPKSTHMLVPRFEMLAKEMERFGCSETEIAEKLLYIFLKTNLSDQIVIALRRYSNISDETVVRLVKYALEAESGEEVETDQKYKGTDLLNVVLSCSYQADVIVPQIRKQLTLEHIRSLLQHLYSMYTAPTRKLEDHCDTFTQFDDDKKILAWVNVVIDASYQHVIVTDDQEFVGIINNWRSIVKTHEDNLKELDGLRPLLHEILRGRTIKKPTRLYKWYNIEKINLW